MWRTLSNEARETIGELCDEHGRHLYDYCRTALAGSDAELAVADALLSAHAHADRLAEPRLKRPWLYALARAHRAAIATTRPASTGSWSRPGVAPDLVPEGLMALDGPHRELLDLSVRHGLTNAEIAAIFDAETFEVAALVAEAADTLEEWFAAVRAARTREGCPRLATRVTDWTKAPGRRNRTRIARHILSCSACRAAPRTVRAATLLHRLPLAAVPSTLREQPAWGRPLPDDDPLWRPDGFPRQARGLVEPPPALISLVPGPTTETREPSWPVAGAAATGQEPPRTGTASGAAAGSAPSRVPSGGAGRGASPGGIPLAAPIGKAPFGTAPGTPLRRATGDAPSEAAADGIHARTTITGNSSTATATSAPPGGATGSAPHGRDPAGLAQRGREPLSPSGTALLDAARQPGERPAPAVPEQQRRRPTDLVEPDEGRDPPPSPGGPDPPTAGPDPRLGRPVATGQAHVLPEIPSQRRTPTRQTAGTRSPQEPPGAEPPGSGTPRRSAEPGDKLVFSGERPSPERPVPEQKREQDRASTRPPEPVQDPQPKREQLWALQPLRPRAGQTDRLLTQGPDRQNVRNPDHSRGQPAQLRVREPGTPPVQEPGRQIVREPDRPRTREPERLNGQEPRGLREEADERWEEFWEGRADEDDPEARISLRWLVRVALVIGLVMMAGGLTWSVFRNQTSGKAAPATGPTALAPAPSAAAPTAQATDSGTEATAPTMQSTTPTAQATDPPQEGVTRAPEPAGKALPAPPAPVARLSPESVQLGTRRTGTFKLSCTGDCEVTSFTGSNGIVISGNTFTVRAPAERPGCSGPPVTESGVVTIGWSGTATGDGRGTEGDTAGDGTLTMLVSWTVTSNKGAFIPDTDGGGYWSNCPKSE